MSRCHVTSMVYQILSNVFGCGNTKQGEQLGRLSEAGIALGRILINIFLLLLFALGFQEGLEILSTFLLCTLMDLIVRHTIIL